MCISTPTHNLSSGLTLTNTIGNIGGLTVGSTISNISNLYGTINSPYTTSISDTYSDYESKLSNLDYTIDFSYDVDSYLTNNIKSIKKKTIAFNCDLNDDDRIQPYELIMKMIHDKRKFDISIDIDGVLTIKYLGVRFKTIQNNFSFSDNKCNFDTLQVKIKYDGIIYDNKNLDITEKRKEKLNKITEI